MILVDASALVRMYLRQPGLEQLRSRVSASISAFVPVSRYAVFALLYRIGSDHMDRLDGQLAAPTFGKGSGHPAQLNFGDCLVYSAAKYRDLPLLFVGDDFRHTDVTPALT